VYDKEYNKILLDKKIYAVFFTKNYIWTFKQIDNKNIVNIYTQKGELFKSIDITQFANKIVLYSDEYFTNKRVIFFNDKEVEQSRKFVFNEDGEFLFDTLTLLPKINEETVKFTGESANSLDLHVFSPYSITETH